MIRCKICCIQSVAEMQLAVRAGVAAIGLVSEMPSGPGVIDEATISEIAAKTPPAVATFLLTSKRTAKEIIAQQQRCRCNTIQLCDGVLHSELELLRTRLPGIALVQVIHVIDQSSILEAVNVAPLVDAILLDSGNPMLKVKELGGTGRIHNWEISREIVATVSRPVFLAGGLNKQNVAEAIAQVHPFGVDVCSGVRTDGRLDEQELIDFLRQVNPVV